ncbi:MULTISPECIES: putative porin [Winogradskyella]|uniref:putative porin n=1 Tax=Winogradskyella TaxID=286104 RepID=UPI0015C8AE44|nr:MULTISPECIES: putative porin [Winogradskyella]QXP77797.1 putative porin [Winogradskyella sp. HaHa_3_26]
MRIKIKYLLIYCLFTLGLTAQNKPTKDNTSAKQDVSSLKKSKGEKEIATIDMYLQYNNLSDSVQVDTTLSIKKAYKFNYLQKDKFGLMPFANIGQTYNSLTFNSWDTSTAPSFGARARHFNYLEHDDIYYYEVPTPWTRLTYKTAFEQGQMLDAFFTVNLSRQFNFAIAYKGLRSLGNYQNVLTSTGNFRFISNYNSKNQKYHAKGYFVAQDLLNNENGGLQSDDIINFTSGNAEFLDRSLFDPQFEDAENTLEGKRFYLEQSYDIIKKKDSLSNNKLALFNKISFEDKYYQYSQTTAATTFFGNAFTTSVNDKVKLEDFKTAIGFQYSNNLLGNVEFALNYTDINYGYDSLVILSDETITNRIQSNYFGVEGAYSKSYKGFDLVAKGGLNLSDTFVGSYLDGVISLKLNEDIAFSGGISINSRLANYNYLLYQSDYINYNWYNLENFNNVNTQQIKFNLNSKKWFNASLDLSNIDNYTYFNLDETTSDGVNVIKPEQYTKPLQYFRLKLQKEFKVGNFALDNTIMFQNVVSDDNVLNVPSFITRNTLYYSNDIFKKSMLLQTGVTLNYFSKYNMNGYDPLLAEFYTQNDTELGGFPMLDFFVNAKVRQTRIFFKIEHFNSSMTGYDYFSAPNNPYRDFAIRFGLVWDFFL